MRCPECKREVVGNDVKVLDTRAVPYRNAIRRRRQCVCGARFSTCEMVASARGDVEDVKFQLALTAIKSQLDAASISIAAMLESSSTPAVPEGAMR